MAENRHRRLMFWSIGLALYALLWGAPVGISQISLLASPARFYYGTLTVAGLALLVCAVWARFRRQGRTILQWCCVSALVLFVNQATGLWFNTILCASPG